VDGEIIEGKVTGRIYLGELAPSGQTDARIKMRLKTGGRTIMKEFSCSVSKRGDINSVKPYSVVIVNNSQRKRIAIPLRGGDVSKLDVRFVGLNNLSIAAGLDAEGINSVIDPFGFKFKNTSLGHFVLFDKGSGVAVYSHPIYVRME
jgi:hypothetical protein